MLSNFSGKKQTDKKQSKQKQKHSQVLNNCWHIEFEMFFIVYFLQH